MIDRQRFKAYDDRCGEHYAETFAFTSKQNRDMTSLILRKDKSVRFVKETEFKNIAGLEYWTTAHYKNK